MSISQFFQSIRTRFWIFGRLIGFLWKNKLWWLIPVILLLVVFFLLMAFVQSTPLGPMIYPLI